MSNYNHTPNRKQSPKQANNAQSDSKLILLKTNLSFGLIDWTAIILFIVLCVTHCVPAYAESNGMRNTSNVTSNAKSNERNGGSNGQSNKNNVTLLNLSNASKVFEHYKKGKNNLTKNETLISVKAISNQSIAGSETVNETVSFKNHLTNGDVGGYYKALSIKVIAVKPNRYTMAFFMPKNCLIFQTKQYNSINFNSFLQGRTLISIANKLLNIYEGATLQNKKAFGRICKAVAITTESEPPHLIFNNNVNLTHKVIGGQI